MTAESTQHSTMGGSVAPPANWAASGGPWSVAEVARLLDVDESQVGLWVRSGRLLACQRQGEVRIMPRALFLFLDGRVELMLSPETVAMALDVETATVRSWLASRRLPSVKLGGGRKAPRRVAAREVNLWLQSLSGEEVAA